VIACFPYLAKRKRRGPEEEGTGIASDVVKVLFLRG